VCLDCPWRERPDVCSDTRNLEWGEFRNSIADFQVLAGGNRIDYNLDPRCHEVPEFYCLDTEFWNPDLEIPDRYRLGIPEETVKIYHGVGHFDQRTDPETLRNIKSSHIYFPLIEELKAEGHDIELMFFKNVPNKELRYYQAQADIVVDMLTFGFYGGNVREAMMLGKPVVCYLRPEWLETMREEIPDYVDEMPIVSATPETVRDVLLDLIQNPEKRREIGRRSREFALRWHSAEAGARQMDSIYGGLLEGRPGTEQMRV
jgi:Glycosyl transferases group 1